MRPVFANSAWVGAPERAILRNGRWRRRLLRVRYGLFIHPLVGPVLIDTGYTAHLVDFPNRTKTMGFYVRVLAPKLVAQEQIEPFLAQFGLAPADISHVIVTHFHADHVSGLAGLPNARFIASGAAWDQVNCNTNFQNLRHGVFAELIPGDFNTRLNAIEDKARQPIVHLPDGFDLFGDGSVLAVPLAGHADGHFGLFFPQLEVPFLYATDTQWVHEALGPKGRPRILPRLISDKFQDVAHSSDQVAAFEKAGGTVLLCHDDAPSQFDFAQGAKL